MDTLASSGLLLFVVVLSEHGRGQVAKARVAALAVVKDFDVFPYGSFGFGARGIAAMMGQFVLQAPPETLDGALS